VGLWSNNVAASNGIKVSQPVTIGQAKFLPLGTKVMFKDVICTGYIYSYNLYVQSPDRSAGIKMLSSNRLAPGTIVDVTGSIVYQGGPCINSPTITIKGTTDVAPLGLNNASIGGSKTGLQDAVTSWRWVKNQDGTSEYKLLPDSGLNNVGLLVKTTGKVTYIDPAGYFAYIDDGSYVDDGNTLGPDGTSIKGIRISLEYDYQSFLKMSPVGSMVTVTGISAIRNQGGYKSVIMLRSQDDIAGLGGGMIYGRIAPLITFNQLIESEHPCTSSASQTWHIVAPEGTEKMRLHFTKILLTNGSQSGNLYSKIPSSSASYYGYWNSEDNWGPWCAGNKVDLTFTGAIGIYGFQMDRYEAIIPMNGVTVMLEPGDITATTDANGYFIFENLAPGTYTLTPSLDGTVFNPLSRDFIIGTNQIAHGVDFSIN
jgi:hypothetical protein